MRIDTRIAELSARLRRGVSRHDLALPAADPAALQQIHYGWYLERTVWEKLSEADRHLARMIAVHRSAATAPVFSRLSAAVLLQLPIYGRIGHEVHIQALTGNRNSSGLIRHRGEITDSEITEVAGLRCTTHDRTLFEVCSSAPMETALACTDGYLGSEFRVHRKIDTERLGAWKQRMDRRVAQAQGARGIRSARRVLELATPHTDSVLESVSHLQLRRLGFEVALQVPVPGPHRNTYYVDFEFPGLRLFGECDGKQKYTDTRLRGARSAQEVVYAEKRREDWLRGSTGYRLLRWGFPDVLTAARLADRLRAFGVQIPIEPSRG